MGIALLILYGLAIMKVATSSRSADTKTTFFLNGRTSSALGIGLSIVVSCVGASATMGMIGLAYTVGTPAFWWLGGGAIGLTLLSVLIAQKVREAGVYTMPQLVEHFLGAPARPLVAFLIVLAWTAILAAQFVAISKVIWALTAFPPLLCSLIGFILIVAHAFGGLASIMRTDKLQTTIMIGALLILLAWLTNHNPDWIATTPMEAYNKDFPPSRLFYFILIVGANYLVCPTLFNRFLSAKNSTSARLGGMVAVVGLLVCAFLIVSIGLACKGLLPVGTSPDDILTTALVHILPQWMNWLICIALISTIVSSADSCLITASTVLTNDIIKITHLRVTRLCVFAFGCLGLAISLWGKSILDFLFMAYDVYACGVVMPVFLGILLNKSHTIDTRFACLAIILGGGCGIVASFTQLSSLSYAGMALSALFVLAGARKKAIPSHVAPDFHSSTPCQKRNEYTVDSSKALL